MLVQQILKSKGNDGVITIKPGTRVSEAAQILAERRIGGLVVSSDGETAEGILSERDIVRSLAVRGANCMQETVDEMMTRNPVCCTRQDSSDAVLTRMTDGRFRHMPVVDGDALIGMITIGDVVHFRLNQLELEALQIKQLIVG